MSGTSVVTSKITTTCPKLRRDDALAYGGTDTQVKGRFSWKDPVGRGGAHRAHSLRAMECLLHSEILRSHLSPQQIETKEDRPDTSVLIFLQHLVRDAYFFSPTHQPLSL
jgi:hypothetical protein